MIEIDDTSDPRWLDGLLDSFGGLAYSLAFRILRDHSAAEDIVQEAFVGIWRRRGSFDASRGEVRTWILSVVRNRAIDRLRANRVRANLSSAPLESVEWHVSIGPDVVSESVLADLDRGAIREAVGSLPEEQRQAIELAYFGGLTQVEIAGRTGVPLGTVKGRIRLGLGKLRDALAQTSVISRSS